MMGKILAFLLVIIVNRCYGKYEPTWDSLDNRHLPAWYDEAKIGIFIHWGVFSVPSFGKEWFWNYWEENRTEYVDFMNKNYPPSWTYQKFAKSFKAEFFDADKWAKLFVQSGAKYVVLTSKHHEGYTLWPSSFSYSWNSMEVGPARDIVGELGTAVRKNNLTFGVYHSLFEWYNPLWLSDKASNFSKQDFVRDKVYPEMKELVENYKPSILWSDKGSDAPATYWKSLEFLAWLYNESPVKDVVVTNDRWGTGTNCTHGGFYSCNDRYNPGTLQKHKWENAMTIDKKSWGYRRNALLSDYFSIQELLKEIVTTVSCGGNILMNIGPTKDGTIDPIYQERLQQTGSWLAINGDGIYGTVPWLIQNDTFTNDVWYTTKNSTLYAIALDWPANNSISLGVGKYVDNTRTVISLLGNEDNPLDWEPLGDYIKVKLPEKSVVKSEWAYTLKISPVHDVSGAHKIQSLSIGAILLAVVVYFQM